MSYRPSLIPAVRDNGNEYIVVGQAYQRLKMDGGVLRDHDRAIGS